MYSGPSRVVALPNDLWSWRSFQSLYSTPLPSVWRTQKFDGPIPTVSINFPSWPFNVEIVSNVVVVNIEKICNQQQNHPSSPAQIVDNAPTLLQKNSPVSCCREESPDRWTAFEALNRQIRLNDPTQHPIPNARIRQGVSGIDWRIEQCEIRWVVWKREAAWSSTVSQPACHLAIDGNSLPVIHRIGFTLQCRISTSEGCAIYWYRTRSRSRGTRNGCVFDPISVLLGITPVVVVESIPSVINERVIWNHSCWENFVWKGWTH